MTERWVKMVKRSKIGQEPSVDKANAMVVTLLARQHRAFVRMVKKLHDQVDNSIPHSNSEADEQVGYMRACQNILAALAKQGGGKT